MDRFSAFEKGIFCAAYCIVVIISAFVATSFTVQPAAAAELDGFHWLLKALYFLKCTEIGLTVV